MIKNGTLARLVIDGIIDGDAGVQGNALAFIPDRATARPGSARSGMLDGQPITLRAEKVPGGPFWHARFEWVSQA